MECPAERGTISCGIRAFSLYPHTHTHTEKSLIFAVLLLTFCCLYRLPENPYISRPPPFSQQSKNPRCFCVPFALCSGIKKSLIFVPLLYRFCTTSEKPPPLVSQGVPVIHNKRCFSDNFLYTFGLFAASVPFV